MRDCADLWEEEVENDICNQTMGNSAAQKKKFKEAIQSFNEAYLSKDAIDEQKTAMEEGQLKYAGLDIKKAVKHLYAINDTCYLFAKG